MGVPFILQWLHVFTSKWKWITEIQIVHKVGSILHKMVEYRNCRAYFLNSMIIATKKNQRVQKVIKKMNDIRYFLIRYKILIAI